MHKNLILGAVGLVCVAAAAWFYTRPVPDTFTPNTPDSTTNWLCNTCREMHAYTAAQVVTMQKEPGRARSDPKRMSKQLVFKCDKCTTYTIVAADQCPDHKLWYARRDPDGKAGMCDECRKIYK